MNHVLQIYVIKRNSCLYVCLPLPWPYLRTNFQTKGTYGLPMTNEWLEKYKKKLNFEKKIFFWTFLKNLKFSLSECFFPPWMPLSNPKGKEGAAWGVPEASGWLEWSTYSIFDRCVKSGKSFNPIQLGFSHLNLEENALCCRIFSWCLNLFK